MRTRASAALLGIRRRLSTASPRSFGFNNGPDNPDLAIAAGTRLCEDLLEPLQDRFGRIAIRSAHRSKEVNGFGNEMQRAGKSGYTCASNDNISWHDRPVKAIRS